MCKLIHNHFICICPNRNDPTCHHHKYLRNHAEFIVVDNGKLSDEQGWYYRLRGQGQSSKRWQPISTEWEQCIYYKLENRDSATREIISGGEGLCGTTSSVQEKPVIKTKTGVCGGCSGKCAELAKRAKEETEKKIAALKKKGMK
ncbi:hypothetical protein QBC43DRAFT_372875 [Cladorrhinum sp. PSN259]|nr:hypothetical protein QBC43DRAFT_372875 [Cladorrhinum sp. PSN259]